MASQKSARRSLTTAEALAPVWRRQVADLRAWENGVRAHRPEAVHQFRVTARRLRSGLAGFEPVIDARPGRTLAKDLRRTAAAVGAARDIHVIRARVDEWLDLEDDLDAPRVRTLLAPLIQHDTSETWRGAIEHLDDPAYDRLTRRAESFADLPPWLPSAHLPADEVLPPLLRTEWSRVQRRARAALDARDGAATDEHLHDARKASKRLRYVAESTTEALGRRAKRLVKAAATVQKALGEHQDQILVQAFLTEAQHRLILDGEDARAVAAARAAQHAHLMRCRETTAHLLRDVADRPSSI